MPRFQGCNADGELMSSLVVQYDQDYGLCFKADPGKTKEEFKDECDINKLMERYEKSGILTHTNKGQPQYLDLGEASALDLMSAMQTLSNAQLAFDSLPAKVRAEFENDAMSFVEFAENEANRDKLEEWGLLKPKEEEPPPQRVIVVGDSADSSKAAPAAE